MDEADLPLGSKLACVLYLVLFPAFFAYHLSAALGVIPLFAGAWWGISTLACFLVLAGFALRKAIVFGPWWLHGSVGVLAALVLLEALYYRAYGLPWQRDQEMFVGSLKLLIAWGGLYSVGFLLQYDSRLQKAAAISLLGMGVAAYLLIDPISVSFIPTEWQGVQQGIAGYQWISQAVLFTGILSLSFARRQRGQILTLATMDATLFLTGSRADLIAAAAVTLGWFAIQVFRRRLLDLAPAAMTLGVTAAFVSVYPLAYIALEKAGPELVEYLTPKEGTLSTGVVSSQKSDAPKATKTETVQRYSELGDLANSPSMIERNKYLWSGWAAIKVSPLVGDYGGQLRDHQRYGAYIHNMLGVWRDFGIVAFALFAALTIAPALIGLWKVLWLGSDDPMWTMTLYAGGSILLLALFIKAVYWPLPALAWGLMASNLVRDRVKSLNSSQQATNKAEVASRR